MNKGMCLCDTSPQPHKEGRRRTGCDRRKNEKFFSRVFLPYETMAQIYPALRKHPRRLPYYELYRWCRLLFRGSARSVWAELRENQKVKAEEIRTAESLLKDLELL